MKKYLIAFFLFAVVAIGFYFGVLRPLLIEAEMPDVLGIPSGIVILKEAGRIPSLQEQSNSSHIDVTMQRDTAVWFYIGTETNARLKIGDKSYSHKTSKTEELAGYIPQNVPFSFSIDGTGGLVGSDSEKPISLEDGTKYVFLNWNVPLLDPERIISDEYIKHHLNYLQEFAQEHPDNGYYPPVVHRKWPWQ